MELQPTPDPPADEAPRSASSGVGPGFWTRRTPTVLAFAVLVWLLLSLPTDLVSVPRSRWLVLLLVPGLGDKLVHGGLFFLLAWLLDRDLRLRRPFRGAGGPLRLRRLGALRLHRLGWTVLLTTAFGGATELFQAFLSYRTASALDLVADLAGAAVFAVGFLLVRHWQRRPQAAGSGPPALH